MSWQIDPLPQQFYTELLYCPSGLRTWSISKCNSEYNCFTWPSQSLSTGVCSCAHPSRYDHKVSIHCMSHRADIECQMTFKCLQYTHSWFSTKFFVSCSRQLVTSPPSVHLVIYFLVWYLIIALGSYTLGLDFLSVSDMVVGAVCHLFQHYSPSNIFTASCL